MVEQCPYLVASALSVAFGHRLLSLIGIDHRPAHYPKQPTHHPPVHLHKTFLMVQKDFYPSREVMQLHTHENDQGPAVKRKMKTAPKNSEPLR